MAVNILPQDVEIVEECLRAHAADIPRSSRKYVKGRSIYLGIMKGGLSPDTRTAHGEHLCQVLNGLLKKYAHEMPFEWCSLVINFATKSDPHKVGTTSVIATFGDFTDGQLQMYEPSGDEFVPVGEKLDVRHKLLNFDARNRPHGNLPYDGERFSVLWFTHCCWSAAHEPSRPELVSLGFVPPMIGARLPVVPQLPVVPRLPVVTRELFDGEADLLMVVLNKHRALIPESTVEKIVGHTLFLGCLESQIADETFTDAGREISSVLLSVLHKHYPTLMVSTIVVDLDTTDQWHRDGKRSVYQTAVITIGPHTGGNLLVKSGGTEPDEIVVHDRVTLFNGSDMHCAAPHKGE